MKATGEYQCPDCWQKFDTEAAKKLHCLEKLEIGTSFTASLQMDEAFSHLNMSKRLDAELRDIKSQGKCTHTNVPKFFVFASLTVFST